MDTKTKERGILFSEVMVNAILEGRKTQTRRVVDWKNLHKQAGIAYPSTCHLAWFGFLKGWGIDAIDGVMREVSPPFAVGDLLWVREAWKTGKGLDGYCPREIADAAEEIGYLADRDHAPCPIKYLADGYHRKWGDSDKEDFGDWGRYRHARFMPRWASRINLEVVRVRVERLQSISEVDAVSEGVLEVLVGSIEKYWNDYLWGGSKATGHCFLDPRESFESLWKSINGLESWAANPFVWVYDFERVLK